MTTITRIVIVTSVVVIVMTGCDLEAGGPCGIGQRERTEGGGAEEESRGEGRTGKIEC